MKTLSLILQADYNQVSLALCNNSTIIETNIDSKHNASRNLVSRMRALLEKHSLHWKNLSFIGLNQGPAPFTTLRVIITTANGLNFAQKIPLVGVDGITTFLNEHEASTPVTVVLLNAFAKDVYFGIKKNDQTITTGWENHQVFLETLKQDFENTPITFIGNGVVLFEKEIKEVFTDYAHIPDPLPEYTSIEAVTDAAFNQWERKENVHDTLLPLYLKTQEYKQAM